MATLDVPPNYPPPPPPKRLSRPKITLQIPDATTPMSVRGPATANSVYWGPSKYHGKLDSTPASRISDPHGNPYFNPFMHMYHNKASEFVFKQFEGFKDFTMNTAKSGLSAGEKSAFWFYNKLRLLSRKWFTHLFLTLCLVLYSIMGAAIFMALEGPHEEIDIIKNYKNVTTVRREVATRIHDKVIGNKSVLHDSNIDFLSLIEKELVEYEKNYPECMTHEVKNKTWTFWNSMYYAGTIYTTIGVLNNNKAGGEPELLCFLSSAHGANAHKALENLFIFIQRQNEIQDILLYRFMRIHEEDYIIYNSPRNDCKVVMNEEGHLQEKLTLKIPAIKAETEAQTVSRLIFKSPCRRTIPEMETEQDKQAMSLKKRRNLLKNRSHSTRQREKTPEPNRTPVPYEDTTTSDDEDIKISRNSREIEADNTYEEMKRLVQEKASHKDPVYDLDIDKVMEERAIAATERRRRSISPFAIPDKEEIAKLERKGSFIDPGTKLLSTNFIMSPKEDDTPQNSPDTEPLKDSRSSVSSISPASSSTKEMNFPYPLPSTPKKLNETVYSEGKQIDNVSMKPKTPMKNENVFTFEEKDIQQNVKSAPPKTPDPPPGPGNLVTKVIMVERSPSKNLMTEKKPVVEIRERVTRTPSTKKTAENKPIVQKHLNKQTKDEAHPKLPPVKPARSKSTSRFVNKTSESEMSEDQANQLDYNTASKRKAMNVPRRFIKHSPRVNRSQSMHRTEDLRVIDRTGTGMSQTSREIIELMQKARARSLSIPKDDPRLPPEYKDFNRNLKTPNKTPSTTPKNTRGISCPKTIQIISDKEILSGLIAKSPDVDKEKQSRHSSGYVDASQSEYTSSCYSSSPSENEYDFDLSERTAELTRKLNILSQEVDMRETMNNIIFAPDNTENKKYEKVEAKSVLRKRSIADTKSGTKKEIIKTEDEKISKSKTATDKTKKLTKSRWKLIANWQTFKEQHKLHYNRIILLRNKCICNILLLILMCGLGGMMFKTLEGSFENAYKCGTRNVKRDFIESLWRGSHYLREEDWKSMARKKLYEFEEQLYTAHEAGVSSYSGQKSWNFMNSFVYCLTLVTTIGYGHIAPKTTYGRVATIVYAIIGIPLFLIILADFGKLFTRIIKFFWSFIRRFYYTRSCRKVRRTVPVQEVMKGLNIVYDVVRRPSQIFSDEEISPDHPPPIVRKPSDVPPPLPPKPGAMKDPENETEPDTPAPSVFEIDDEFNLPISLAIFILVVYIIIGAVAYNLWEDWNFFESFYFVFISMSTIGLGDLVPKHPMYMMASIWYLVFGLALTSMCINVVQLKLSNTFKQASAKIGATIGLKVAEEDGSLVPITPPPTEIAPIHKPKTETEDSKSKEEQSNDVKTS